jgi:hypothetical protein
MIKLIALLALAGAVAAGVVFFWRNRKSVESTWTSAKGSTAEWAKTANDDEAGKAAETVAAKIGSAANTASQFADEMKDTLAGKTEFPRPSEAS